MAVKKITISLEPELADEVAARASATSVSTSRWISEAIEDRLRNLGLGELIAEYEAEYGAFTAAEKEATRKFWQESLSTQEPSSPSSDATDESGALSQTSRRRRAG